MNPPNKYHSLVTEHKHIHIQHHKHNDKDPYHACITQNISNPHKTTCTSYVKGELPLNQKKKKKN